ncbi:App1 family protein [Nocardioides salsibiostraticola]
MSHPVETVEVEAQERSRALCQTAVMPDPSPTERPHIARVVEDRWNAGLGALLSRRGWDHRIVPHVGYAGSGFIRVFARVLFAPESRDESPRRQPEDPDASLDRRGWRNFITAEAQSVDIEIGVGDETYTARTDSSGNLDARIPNPGLSPGWHRIDLRSERSATVPARIRVIDDEASFGIVSDIDDTVLSTLLPRPLVAAYNTFVAREEARSPVSGMAVLYRDLLRHRSNAPTIYVSTGAWNTAGTLRRFLARNAFPDGPMLLTDWGPTNTGWFRSGRAHKEQCLESLAEDFPNISWVLVGDDGQRDPLIYGDFARRRPERVRAIAIRELSLGQQVLAHGTPIAAVDHDSHADGVPEVRGRDGEELGVALTPVL